MGTIIPVTNYFHYCISNLHKKAKKARHEQEKEYMNSLAGLGEAVGEYSGHGQGEQEDPTQVNEDGVSDDEDSMETRDIDSDTIDAKPVHIFFDIETTGLNIYNDHINHRDRSKSCW